MTIPQVKRLSQRLGQTRRAQPQPDGKQDGSESKAFSQARPAVPSNAVERFLEVAEDQSGPTLIYQPALMASGAVRFLDRDHGIDEITNVSAVSLEPDRRGMVSWDEYLCQPLPEELLRQVPSGEPGYQDLAAPLNDRSLMSQMSKDFEDYLYRTSELALMANPTVDLVAAPGETKEDFSQRCLEAATALRDEEAQKVKDKYQKKIETMRKKISKEQRELTEDMSELSSRRMEEWVTHAENLLGFLGGSRSRRRVSSSMTKRRMTSKAKADVSESEESIVQFQKDLDNLELEMAEELDELSEEWVEKADSLEQEVITPRRKDIHVELFGVLWLPFWQEAAGQLTPAYDPELLDPA
jgi:hypothetical protein